MVKSSRRDERTIIDLLVASIGKAPKSDAALRKVDGNWQKISWHQLGQMVGQAAIGLTNLGVTRGSRVAILSNTRLEWAVIDLATVAIGACVVPIYQSTNEEDAEFILSDAGVECIVVEDTIQAEKVRKNFSELEALKTIICLDASAVNPSEHEISYDEVLKTGNSFNGDFSLLAPKEKNIDDLASIVYTSGTTGKPKGVMLTHGNFVYEGAAIEKLGLLNPNDVQLLFLPLAHIFAKVLMLAWIKTGHVLAFAESIDKVVDNMAEVKPTMMAAVPRIYEKIHAKIVATALAASGLKPLIAQWAFTESVKTGRRAAKGKGPTWKMAIAQKLVFDKIAQSLSNRFGGRLRFFVSGGAPLSREVAYFFHHADVMICEGYGLTETTAATTINTPTQMKIGSVGKPVPGTELRIAEDGEILIKGGGVFSGYWRQPEATQEALQDGWFKTGDIGEIDENGMLTITDRKKDIIVTAGGKNIAPQGIENNIKAKCHLISHVLVHGDKRKFLSALIALDKPSLMEWSKTRSVPGTYQQLCHNPAVIDIVEKAIVEYNLRTASYNQIKKHHILDEELVIGNDLTPTLKLKRKILQARYKKILDAFYPEV